MSYAEQKAYRERRRVKALAHLGGKCARCDSQVGLHFDHVDPSTKVLAISEAITAAWSWSRLVHELAKCQLLCDDHHREKSLAEGDYGGGHNKIRNPPHGTAVRYGKEKCRCKRCRAWKKAYREGLVDARNNPRL